MVTNVCQTVSRMHLKRPGGELLVFAQEDIQFMHAKPYQVLNMHAHCLLDTWEFH